jgi:hypothetical protein
MDGFPLSRGHIKTSARHPPMQTTVCSRFDQICFTTCFERKRGLLRQFPANQLPEVPQIFYCRSIASRQSSDDNLLLAETPIIC